MRSPLKNVRHIALIVFFLGLATLEVAHGVFRLDSIRERRRLELRDRVERDHRDLAGELHDLLAQKREHAAYLARAPAVSSLLASPHDAAARGELESMLLPYLVSFRSIDRVRILDARGKEAFRCERIGGAVGALPESLLSAEPDSGMLELASGLSAGEVAVSPLSIDRGRVEVPECDRQVLHYASRVDGDGESGGIAVLTVYAQPLLDGVRRFRPLEGVDAVLVDSMGTPVIGEAAPAAPPATVRPQPIAEQRLAAARLAAGRLASGDERVEVDGVSYVGLEVHRHPAWLLVCRIPERALDDASRELRGEYGWIIGSTVLLTAAIAVVAAILVRLSVRELRLRERDRVLELERRLRVSERLGSLGLLTAGVAHEINNPLEAIGNYLALLDRDHVPEDNRRRYLGRVRHGFGRIRDIVRDLSGFTRPEDHGRIADIAQVVRRALVMARYSRGFDRGDVELVGLEKPIRVAGEAGRLEQVFINLLLNAARAGGHHGRIRIEARRLNSDDARRAASSDPLVEIRVEDDGPGIAEEDIERIFDPFFTRAPPDADRSPLGLGLFISYGIIDAHGGSLWAENRDEGGARFVIQLPAAEESREKGAVCRESRDAERIDDVEERGE